MLSNADVKNIARFHFPLMLSLRRFVGQNAPLIKDLTPQQTMILIILDMSGPIRLSDLAMRTMVTHGTTVVAIQKLIKKGLVLKKKDHADERAVALSLSAKGKTISNGIKENLCQGYQVLCESLPSKDVKKLFGCYQFMTKIFENFKKVGPQ